MSSDKNIDSDSSISHTRWEKLIYYQQIMFFHDYVFPKNIEQLEMYFNNPLGWLDK